MAAIGDNNSLIPAALKITKVQGQNKPNAQDERTRELEQQSINLIQGLSFPPRSSSIPQNFTPTHQIAQVHLQQRIQSRAASFLTGTTNSSRTSSGILHRLSDTTGHHSTADSDRSRNISTSSSGMLGDFIPFDSPDMAEYPVHDSHGALFDASPIHRTSRRKTNPFEFEPGTPYAASDRGTTFGDFISSSTDHGTRKHNSHKNRAGNTMSVTPEGSLDVPQTMARGQALYRSGSSPGLPATRFIGLQRSPSLGYLYDRDEEPLSSARCPRQTQDLVASRGRQMTSNRFQPALSHRYDTEYRDISQSQSHSPYHGQGSAQPSPRSLKSTQPPANTLYDIAGQTDIDFPGYEAIVETQKKRSRSPMKKMFGEHGWLGRSPGEANIAKFQGRKSIVGTKQEIPKKSTMAKLRSKLEEFAEKADLSPVKSSHLAKSKEPNLSMLAVSLDAAQQAKICMEIELMLVTSANNFLMRQFSQGRIFVDSIKKVVDGWKSKGRPIVTQFMYDQATQRDLVAANQHNFQFHGERAGDGIRISSMLYNWKQVAALMAIRTFCNTDTVLMKLLFDAEQILELLGASEPTMYRLKQIRIWVNEAVRSVRQDSATPFNADSFQGGREVSWESHKLSGNFIGREVSKGDPYGGMKLVPETYAKGL